MDRRRAVAVAGEEREIRQRRGRRRIGEIDRLARNRHAGAHLHFERRVRPVVGDRLDRVGEEIRLGMMLVRTGGEDERGPRDRLAGLFARPDLRTWRASAAADGYS